MTERATLPDLDTLDFAALKALILSHHEQLLSKQEQLASRDSEIEQLKLLIGKFRRMQFGRKSEKLDRQIAQLELKLDELEASRAERAAQTAKTTKAEAPGVKPVRRPLPAHLPREERKILPKQEACPDCGGRPKPLGEDISEILEYIPEHFKVIRQIRLKLACAGCDKIVSAAYKKLGWRIVRLWEHAIRRDPKSCVLRVKSNL
jgi:transposase